MTGDLNWRPYAGALEPDLIAVLDKATQKFKEVRYQSASEMNRALRKLLPAPVINKIKIPIPDNDPKRSFVPRAVLYAVASLLVLVVLGGLLGAIHLYRKGVLGATNSNSPQPHASSCVLFNDDLSQQTVNIRADCDRKSCDLDESTILKEYPNNTLIRVNREITVKSRRNFNWTQIVIIESGEVAWVASSKYRCN
jgi:hypothetical protein